MHACQQKISQSNSTPNVATSSIEASKFGFFKQEDRVRTTEPVPNSEQTHKRLRAANEHEERDTKT